MNLYAIQIHDDKYIVKLSPSTYGLTTDFEQATLFEGIPTVGTAIRGTTSGWGIKALIPTTVTREPGAPIT